MPDAARGATETVAADDLALDRLCALIERSRRDDLVAEPDGPQTALF